MKKEYAFLFIAVAFVAGIVVGVIAAVYHEDKGAPVSSPMKQPAASAPAPAVPTAETQNQIASLQTILKGDPKNLTALVQLGNLYFDSGDADKAIEVYSRALEQDPKNADVRTDLGIMYRRKGEFDRAVAEFQKAAEMNPTHVNSRYNLGIVLLHDKSDMKGAIKAWEDFLKVEPKGERADTIRDRLEKMRSMAK
jgi:cytochrome c-type biogenesis protein CcmH/NrfG